MQLTGADHRLASLPNDTWVNVTGQINPTTTATNEGTTMTVEFIQVILAQPYDD